MLATTSSISYGLTLAAHVILALAALVIFVVLRMSAAAVANGASPEEQAKRFPNRTNWSARLFHLMPLTGLALVGIGGASVSFSHAWVGIGALLWVLAAGHLEARVLPSERAMAAAIATAGTADPASGKKLGLSIDVLLGLIVLAVLVMVVQP